MRLSKLFTKTLKNAPSDQESLNGKLLTRAGFIHQETSGVYSFLPLGLLVLNKIENIIREEMNAIGGQEILMSALAPTEYWEKTGRLSAMSTLFKATGANKESTLNNDKDYVLSPTHEETITPLVQKYIFSYKDLPILPYQIQSKFRNEARARGGLLRGREFRMKDLYSFHADASGFESFYQEAATAYAKVFKRLSLHDLTYYTYAAGGDYTKRHTHEFQTLMENGEDTIYICQKCQSPHGAGLAYNKEIITDSSQFKCLECGGSDFLVEKASEVGNIFPLETRFSEAFGFFFTDKDGTQKHPIMGCYGIGPSRVMGVLAEVFSDAKGLKWPKAVAPFDVHLVDLTKDGSGQAVYDELTSRHISVLWDEREAVSAGVKFTDADLIGIPTQIILSERSKEQGGVEVRTRGEEGSKIIKAEDLPTINNTFV